MKKDFFEWFRLITPVGIAIVGWLMITNIGQFKEIINFRFDKLEKDVGEIKQLCSVQECFEEGFQ